MERFPPLSEDKMDAAQREMALHYRSGWRSQLAQADGRLGGPLDAMLRSPELAKRISQLSDYFRTETTLPQHLNEMAIIMTARDNRSNYEWAIHRPWAEREGLPCSIGDALMAHKRPPDMSAQEEAVYEILTELRELFEVTDSTFTKAKKVFTERQILELVAVSGLYTLVARVLAIAEIPAPGNNPDPLGRQSSTAS